MPANMLKFATLETGTAHMSSFHLKCPRTDGLLITNFPVHIPGNVETRSLLSILSSEPLGPGKNQKTVKVSGSEWKKLDF